MILMGQLPEVETEIAPEAEPAEKPVLFKDLRSK